MWMKKRESSRNGPMRPDLQPAAPCKCCGTIWGYAQPAAKRPIRSKDEGFCNGCAQVSRSQKSKTVSPEVAALESADPAPDRLTDARLVRRLALFNELRKAQRSASDKPPDRKPDDPISGYIREWRAGRNPLIRKATRRECSLAPDL